MCFFLCMRKPVYRKNLKLFPLIKCNILINESKLADVLVFFNQILKAKVRTSVVSIPRKRKSFVVRNHYQRMWLISMRILMGVIFEFCGT